MKKYPKLKELQKKIIVDGTARLTYQAKEMTDVIHPFSVEGYEYLSGSLVEFLDRFRTVIPDKLPIVLEIKGKKFSNEEKKTIDRAIWTHYGLYLSERDADMRATKRRMFIYLIMTILSSSLMFLVNKSPDEVVVNYGSVLFWFFAYRLLIQLVLDFQPVYLDYLWYRRLTSMKLIFSEDADVKLDTEKISKETLRYAMEADDMIKNSSFVKNILMEETYMDLGCRIENVEEALIPSGAQDIEILSSELADYLMSVLPFIKKESVTKLTIECDEISKKDQKRIEKALRNYLAFTIFDKEAEGKFNKGISIFFAICTVLSTLILYLWGKGVNLAVHEFILVLFWFFVDYLLDFVILSRMDIKAKKKTLEKLANMEIQFKNVKK